MKIVVIDADYTYNKKNEPVIRLYGKNVINDENVCLHVTDFESYIYIGCPNEYDIIKFISIIEKKFVGYYKRIEVVKKYYSIGYQIEKSNMLKVIFFNPKVVIDVRKMLVEEIEYMSDELIYEADILFRDRFMVDMGIDGMSVIEFDHIGKELNNYGINSDNIYIIGLNNFKVIDEKVNIEY